MDAVNEVKMSVITVCYNSEKTIRRTIESVINQTYKNYEYIIVDGKSTDNTVSIIEDYSKDIEELVLISEPDNGIYDAMNKGIMKAKGEIIAIINSDDWFEKDAFELVVNEYIRLGKPKEAIIYGAVNVVDNDRIRYQIFYRHEFLPYQMINHPASFVTKSVYAKYGMFDLRFKLSADFDLFLRLFFEEQKTGNTLFYPFNKVLSNFALGGASSSVESFIDHDRVLLKQGLISKKEYTMHTIVRTIKRIFGYS